MSPLLTREAFQAQVFARSAGRCVLCPAMAVDAHHILDRKLFSDGGYVLINGAAVCAQCHWACETTQVSVEQVRLAAGITQAHLPPGWDPDVIYDKWGNRCWPSGARSLGPLGEDAGMLRALAAGGFRQCLVAMAAADPWA